MPLKLSRISITFKVQSASSLQTYLLNFNPNEENNESTDEAYSTGADSRDSSTIEENTLEGIRFSVSCRGLTGRNLMTSTSSPVCVLESEHCGKWKHEDKTEVKYEEADPEFSKPLYLRNPKRCENIRFIIRDEGTI